MGPMLSGRSHPLRKALAACAGALSLVWLTAVGDAEAKGPRDFRTFLPKSSDVIQEPEAQVMQLLLDRQDQGEYESYMVQVLFRNKPPAEHDYRVFPDRIEIDFLDTGKPSMRLAKIRGGALAASSLEELFYRDTKVSAHPRQGSRPVIKRLVRLTLFMNQKADPKLRDTLDRTLIHFRLAKPVKAG